MKWLQGNPLGMALAGLSGIFILLAVVMAIFWSLPVSDDITATATEGSKGEEAVLVAHSAHSLDELQVINEKPVFNESRKPVIEAVEAERPVEKAAIAVKGVPDVVLTGVIITPGVRIASLKPADRKLDNVMAHEGQSLTGEYVGWQVSSVKPRNVVLESRDGQTVNLELQIHDAKIKEPPKPVAKTKTKPGGQKRDSDDEKLSRAEQIRQRIAERREELRREQEGQQADGVQTLTAPAGRESRNRSQKDSETSEPANYQSAIRNLMHNKPKDQASDDKKDN